MKKIVTIMFAVSQFFTGDQEKINTNTKTGIKQVKPDPIGALKRISQGLIGYKKTKHFKVDSVLINDNEKLEAVDDLIINPTEAHIYFENGQSGLEFTKPGKRPSYKINGVEFINSKVPVEIHLHNTTQIIFSSVRSVQANEKRIIDKVDIYLTNIKPVR